MSIGIAIFASVVLVLVVYNRDFRKFIAWSAGISTALAAVVFGFVFLRDYQRQKEFDRGAAKAAADAERAAVNYQHAVDDCGKRFEAHGWMNHSVCESDTDAVAPPNRLTESKYVDTSGVMHVRPEHIPQGYVLDEQKGR